MCHTCPWCLIMHHHLATSFSTIWQSQNHCFEICHWNWFCWKQFCKQTMDESLLGGIIYYSSQILISTNMSCWCSNYRHEYAWSHYFGFPTCIHFWLTRKEVKMKELVLFWKLRVKNKSQRRPTLSLKYLLFTIRIPFLIFLCDIYCRVTTQTHGESIASPAITKFRFPMSNDEKRNYVSELSKQIHPRQLWQYLHKNLNLFILYYVFATDHSVFSNARWIITSPPP